MRVVSADVDRYDVTNLHVVAHTSVGRDEVYENKWFRQDHLKEKLTLKNMFWSENRCAVFVSLSNVKTNCKLPYSRFGKYIQTSFPYCKVDSFPHVSLVKDRHDTWSDLGLWVKQCEGQQFWQQTQDSCVTYNPVLMYTKKNCVKWHRQKGLFC